MAKKKDGDDFTIELIKSLNKDHGARVAYNLTTDDSPTHVKRWISTGSKQLDFIISGLSLLISCLSSFCNLSRPSAVIGNFAIITPNINSKI